jgi:5-methylcytosine-specific restriction endonuclease McrA
MALTKNEKAANRRAYYLANKERYSEQHRAWLKANVERVAAYSKAYCEANAEKVAAGKKAWRKANREKSDAQMRAWRLANPKWAPAWRKANPTKVHTANKLYKKAHPELVSSWLQAWRLANSERVATQTRIWKTANRRKVAATQQRREARKAQVENTLTFEEFQDIIQLAAGRCHYCRQLRTLSMEHVIPIAKFGPHAAHNIVMACKSCNSSKCDSDVSVFLARMTKVWTLEGNTDALAMLAGTAPEPCTNRHCSHPKVSTVVGNDALRVG